jgi:hypothetical protein
MRAGFRTPSPELTPPSGALFRWVTLPQSREGPNSAHRHHPFNSGFSPISAKPDRTTGSSRDGRSAGTEADLRSVIRAKKDTIRLQHAAIAHVYEAGR